ncbi:ankyrin repeat-containing domain protein [Podospora aff. communis PSN243]|uniref:Ankyrin repeat-containing domain protein n=1 Tax=Podospora aff. communis PSN243 TaxID=3040156 RepID=A0AAV9G6X7_9PEZI|nr:ankyrin repeat-containing domain protein [Podospora aff. communis PSN243]
MQDNTALHDAKPQAGDGNHETRPRLQRNTKAIREAEYEGDLDQMRGVMEEKPHGTPERENSPKKGCVFLDDSNTPQTASPSEANFLSAAQRGQLSDLRRYFHWPVSVNTACDRGATALHYASYMGHTSIVKALLDFQADPGIVLNGVIQLKERSISHPTPLCLAVVRGNVAVVKLLLERALGMSSHSALGESEPGLSLAWALQFGQTEIATVLLEHGARLRITPRVGHLGPGNPESFLPVRSSRSPEPLQVEAETGLRLIERLLAPESDAAGLDIGREVGSSIFIQGPRCHDDLDLSVTTVHVDYSNYLCCMNLGLLSTVSQFAPFFELQRDANGWTPFHHAVMSGNVDVVNAMLAWGFSTGMSSWGCDLNIATPVGFTPLHLVVTPGAPRTEQSEVITSLLSHGAQINAPDNRDYTPLHIASEQHDLQVMSQLLIYGLEDNAQQANPNSITIDSITPLDLAVSGNAAALQTAEAAAGMLLRAGADVNCPGRHQKTALHHAVSARNTSLVHLLLEFGAHCELSDVEQLGRMLLHHDGENRPFVHNSNGTGSRPRSRSGVIEDLPEAEFEILSTLFASLDDGAREAAICTYGGEFLKLAARRGSLPCVQLLLQRGAVTDREGVVNYSVVKIAASHENREMVSKILRHSIQGWACDEPEYDMFLRLLSAFLDGSDASSLVSCESARIIREGGVQEQLLEMAKQKGLHQLVQYWEDQMGVGCCDPASIFRLEGGSLL